MSVRSTTTDLYESSYLVTRGMRLVDVWVDRGRAKPTAVFVFEGRACRLRELQRSYHTGTAMVNLTDFRGSLINLRRRMHAALSNHQGRNHHGPLNSHQRQPQLVAQP